MSAQTKPLRRTRCTSVASQRINPIPVPPKPWQDETLKPRRAGPYHSCTGLRTQLDGFRKVSIFSSVCCLFKKKRSDEDELLHPHAISQRELRLWVDEQTLKRRLYDIEKDLSTENLHATHGGPPRAAIEENFSSPEEEKFWREVQTIREKVDLCLNELHHSPSHRYSFKARSEGGDAPSERDFSSTPELCDNGKPWWYDEAWMSPSKAQRLRDFSPELREDLWPIQEDAVPDTPETCIRIQPEHKKTVHGGSYAAPVFRMSDGSILLEDDSHSYMSKVDAENIDEKTQLSVDGDDIPTLGLWMRDTKPVRNTIPELNGPQPVALSDTATGNMFAHVSDEEIGMIERIYVHGHVGRVGLTLAPHLYRQRGRAKWEKGLVIQIHLNTTDARGYCIRYFDSNKDYKELKIRAGNVAANNMDAVVSRIAAGKLTKQGILDLILVIDQYF